MSTDKVTDQMSDIAVVVIVVADYGVKSLVNVSARCVGESGVRGQSKHCHGANADNTVIHVSIC